jgi:hypothetical protein
MEIERADQLVVGDRVWFWDDNVMRFADVAYIGPGECHLDNVTGDHWKYPKGIMVYEHRLMLERRIFLWRR